MATVYAPVAVSQAPIVQAPVVVAYPAPSLPRLKLFGHHKPTIVPASQVVAVPAQVWLQVQPTWAVVARPQGVTPTPQTPISTTTPQAQAGTWATSDPGDASTLPPPIPTDDTGQSSQIDAVQEHEILEALEEVKAQVGDEDGAVLRRELELNARELVAEFTGRRPDDPDVGREAQRLVERVLNNSGAPAPEPEEQPAAPPPMPDVDTDTGPEVQDPEGDTERDMVYAQPYRGPALPPAASVVAQMPTR